MGEIMHWARSQHASRSEAIRQLIEIGLSKPTQPPALAVISTATEAAARAAKARTRKGGMK